MKPIRIITLFTLLLTFLCCTKRGESPGHLRIGEPLPEFSTFTLDGQNVSTASLLEKPAVIVFFSTTCPDCHHQLPEVEIAYKNYKYQASFLAIAREENETTVRNFWTQAGYSMPVSAPGNRVIYNLFDRDSGSGVPQVYIADRDGIVTAFSNDRKLLFAEDFYSILQSILSE